MIRPNFILILNLIFVSSSCNIIKTFTQKDAKIDSAFFSGKLVAFEVFEIAVQEQEKIVTLNYSGEKAPISCSVSNTTDSYISTPCSCTLGVCQVGITGNTGFYGMAYADYTISDESASTSNSKINLDIDFVCQPNWTRVPANSSLGIHNDFCVMTYEAKTDVSGNAISSPDTTPWVNISAVNAKTKCTNLGTKYDLISNPEWMTIAHNIEAVSENWTRGIVGNGCLFRGNVGGLAPCDNNDTTGYNGADPDYGLNRTDNGTASLTLSNGEVIWDFSGNVWEWVDWEKGGGFDLAPTTCADSLWIELYSINCSDLLPIDYLPLNPNGIGSNSYGSSYGLGMFLGGTGGAAIRGGRFDFGTTGGIYTLSLTPGPTMNNSAFGFRCVWRP